jgi:uncharacterized circularly permuted ATP-grasp superfamily protein
MLAPILHELDQEIVNDVTLDQSAFDALIAAQRALGLIYGERPTCPFLRPHIIARSQYDQISRAAQIIVGAIEKIADQALRDEAMLSLMGLTSAEAKMARIDPGYSCLCVSSRLDAYFSESGFQFLEYNAETPAGVGDQMQLEKALFGLAHIKKLLAQHAYWRPEPHKRLLSSLLQAYREWGGDAERPQIAIVDWKGVATEAEFRTLKQFFSAAGYDSIIADPRELSYDDGQLRAGNFKIDILYKRVIIHEFLERCGDQHALARAYADRRVCMVNSFRSKIAHKKASFAILSDSKFAHLFTTAELEVLRRHIPWTRRVANCTTTFAGAEHDLIELIRANRERFVLKPNDDYGGHGVFIGWETTRQDWESAIALATSQPYVVQARVKVDKTSIPTFTDRVQSQDLFIDFNPFLFHNEVEGALIRLSSSPLLNVSAGGGQTALLVLEET